MTDDRTLLEAAARAAGIAHIGYTTGRGLHLGVEGDPDSESGWWNPLQDVAQATRLLLALRLRVEYVGDQPCIEGVMKSGFTAEESFCRAVTYAAAAMAGKAQE